MVGHNERGLGLSLQSTSGAKDSKQRGRNGKTNYGWLWWEVRCVVACSVAQGLPRGSSCNSVCGERNRTTAEDNRVQQSGSLAIVPRKWEWVTRDGEENIFSHVGQNKKKVFFWLCRCDYFRSCLEPSHADKPAVLARYAPNGGLSQGQPPLKT